MTTGNNISTWRPRLKRLRVKQKDLAEQVGVSESYLCEIFSGKKTGITVGLYNLIEDIIHSMEMREARKAERRAQRKTKTKPRPCGKKRG